MEFGYFPIKGRAEPLRYLFAYMNLEYKEKNPEYKYWYSNRKNMGFDFPNVPYLIDGSVKVTESRAIILYVLNKLGKRDMLGAPGQQEILHETLMGIMLDIQNAIFSILFAPNYKDVYEFRRKFHIRPKLEYINAYTKDKTFLLGDKPLVVDFYLLFFMEFLSLTEETLEVPLSINQYPNVVKVLENINNLEAIKKYKETDPRRLFPFMVPNFAVLALKR